MPCHILLPIPRHIASRFGTPCHHLSGLLGFEGPAITLSFQPLLTPVARLPMGLRHFRVFHSAFSVHCGASIRSAVNSFDSKFEFFSLLLSIMEVSSSCYLNIFAMQPQSSYFRHSLQSRTIVCNQRYLYVGGSATRLQPQSICSPPVIPSHSLLISRQHIYAHHTTIFLSAAPAFQNYHVCISLCVHQVAVHCTTAWRP